MTAPLVPIEGDIRDYAWGTPGGVSRALGRPETAEVEAELWLGAHPSAPSRAVTDAAGWRDLAEWERSGQGRVPYLLKVLSAVSPLSLQAHPTPPQAAKGFARENAEGISLDAPQRNYKDPYAKPELIVALEDGFEALCGFRPLAQTRSLVRELAEVAPDAAPFVAWEAHLAGGDGIHAAFAWLLGGGPEIDGLLAGIAAAAEVDAARWELPARIAVGYPGDPGIAVALMLNHVTLAAGESLWLPAGNIHAYLRGTGMELMGPSDNVLRGGLTPKHVDIAELEQVLDFTDGEPPYLPPIAIGENVRSYRPRTLPSGADVPFELWEVTGAGEVETTSPAIALAVDGAFTIATADASLAVDRGASVFVGEPGRITVTGTGRLFVAAA